MGAGGLCLSQRVGSSFRTVTPVTVSDIGLLLRGGRVDCGNVPDNTHTQGDQELGTSVGACRAGSFVSEKDIPGFRFGISGLWVRVRGLSGADLEQFESMG